MSISNTTSFGADVLAYASLKGQQDSGPLFFALAYAADLATLRSKIEFAQANNEKLRPITVAHFDATPEGEELAKEYAALKATKAKTVDQTVRQQTILELYNQVHVQLLRSVETVAGIAKLRLLGRTVNVQRIANSTKYACYVLDARTNDDGTQREFIYVPFTATQLRKLGEVGSVNDAMTTADIRSACDSHKAGTPNNDKGSNETLKSADIGTVAKQLDTALSGRFDDNGKLQGVSTKTREEVMLLWAMIETEASAAEKAAALAAYRKLSATVEQTVAIEQAATKVKAPRKAKATAAA